MQAAEAAKGQHVLSSLHKHGKHLLSSVGLLSSRSLAEGGLQIQQLLS